ncbi:MAG: DUF1285 domain-containing protein [Myxococcales bacterium]|nr:DUF1285 domain-containing protein [Myxococcales bacterium]
MSKEDGSVELSRETSIRRDAQGTWYHDGDPVTNTAVARAFDAWVDIAEDGRCILHNSVNWAYVEIDGPPIFIHRAWTVSQGLELKLSDGQLELLDMDTVYRDVGGRLYCRVREGRLLAGFTRQAMLDLIPILDGDEQHMYLCVGGWHEIKLHL